MARQLKWDGVTRVVLASAKQEGPWVPFSRAAWSEAQANRFMRTLPAIYKFRKVVRFK